VSIWPAITPPISLGPARPAAGRRRPTGGVGRGSPHPRSRRALRERRLRRVRPRPVLGRAADPPRLAPDRVAAAQAFLNSIPRAEWMTILGDDDRRAEALSKPPGDYPRCSSARLPTSAPQRSPTAPPQPPSRSPRSTAPSAASTAKTTSESSPATGVRSRGRGRRD
jgi:hypothetical protein